MCEGEIRLPKRITRKVRARKESSLVWDLSTVWEKLLFDPDANESLPFYPTHGTLRGLHQPFLVRCRPL